jgi:hypothetical protein
MIRLRAPLSIATSVGVGAVIDEPKTIDEAVATAGLTLATIATVGGLFGVVLWGLKGALIGGGIGVFVGYVVLRSADAQWAKEHE